MNSSDNNSKGDLGFSEFTQNSLLNVVPYEIICVVEGFLNRTLAPYLKEITDNEKQYPKEATDQLNRELIQLISGLMRTIYTYGYQDGQKKHM